MNKLDTLIKEQYYSIHDYVIYNNEIYIIGINDSKSRYLLSKYNIKDNTLKTIFNFSNLKEKIDLRYSFSNIVIDKQNNILYSIVYKDFKNNMNIVRYNEDIEYNNDKDENSRTKYRFGEIFNNLRNIYLFSFNLISGEYEYIDLSENVYDDIYNVKLFLHEQNNMLYFSVINLFLHEVYYSFNLTNKKLKYILNNNIFLFYGIKNFFTYDDKHIYLFVVDDDDEQDVKDIDEYDDDFILLSYNILDNSIDDEETKLKVGDINSINNNLDILYHDNKIYYFKKESNNYIYSLDVIDLINKKVEKLLSLDENIQIVEYSNIIHNNNKLYFLCKTVLENNDIKYYLYEYNINDNTYSIINEFSLKGDISIFLKNYYENKIYGLIKLNSIYHIVYFDLEEKTIKRLYNIGLLRFDNEHVKINDKQFIINANYSGYNGNYILLCDIDKNTIEIIYKNDEMNNYKMLNDIYYVENKIYGLVNDNGKFYLYKIDLLNKKFDLVLKLYDNVDNSNNVFINYDNEHCVIYAFIHFNDERGHILFSINLKNEKFEELLYFKYLNIIYPGNSILYKNSLYGTGYISKNGRGILFSYNLIKKEFSILHKFEEETGCVPYVKMRIENGILYGKTLLGGKYENGTYYKFDIENKKYEVIEHVKN